MGHSLKKSRVLNPKESSSVSLQFVLPAETFFLSVCMPVYLSCALSVSHSLFLSSTLQSCACSLSLSFLFFVCLSVDPICLSTYSPISYYQDILLVTWFVHATTIFSDWFWLVFLVIPGYLFYQYGGFVLSMLGTYLFGAGDVEGPPETAQERKRREKKERQANRPKFRMMRN